MSTIAKILRKYAKKGDKLYSPMFGEATFNRVTDEEYGCIFIDKDGDEYTFNDDGTWNSQGEPILFPSYEQRDWDEYVKEKTQKLSKSTYVFNEYRGLGKIIDSALDKEYGGITYCIRWLNSNCTQWSDPGVNVKDQIVTKFDAKMLKPFDKVLVKVYPDFNWGAALFSHYDNTLDRKYCTADNEFAECVPYNEDTKHLVGTNDNPPEFYW